MAKKPPKPITENHSVKRAAFLAAYAQLGNITAASKAAGCDPSTHRACWMKQPGYPELFAEAHEQAIELMEAEALRRATRGTDKPVFHKGKQVGTIREYSDVLLIFLLKAAKPDKYRDNVEHNHTGAVTIKMFGQEAPVDRV